MTRSTRATCTRALYARLEALDDDLRTNTDYYDRHDWRGQIHRKRAAAEIMEIRAALRELRFIEWAVAA
jgi:hypothetical protein